MHDNAHGSKWPRIATLTGVVFFVLAVLGGIIDRDAPEFLPEGKSAAAYYAGDPEVVLAASSLYLLSVAFLLWFLGSLYAHLRHHEGVARGDDHGRLAHTALAGGVAGAALMLASAAISVAGALRADEYDKIDSVLAIAYYDISSVLFGLAAPMAMGVLVFACAVLAFRTAAFPKWWGIVSVLLGITLLIPPISWAAMLAFLVWVAVTSVLTYTAHTRLGDHDHGHTHDHGAA